MNLLEPAFGRGTVLVAVALAIGAWLAAPGPSETPELETPESEHRVVVTETEYTILDVVEFEPGTATLRATSLSTLDAVVATLQGNPSIERVEVQAHTSGIGDEVANLNLTQLRAAAVAGYLIDAGVSPTRLEAAGYGDTQPISRTTPANNERVAFVILKRSSDGD
jgi:OmpA-OmpF porin, OOP family